VLVPALFKAIQLLCITILQFFNQIIMFLFSLLAGNIASGIQSWSIVTFWCGSV